MTTFCICCFRVYVAVSNMDTRFASSESDSFRFVYVNTHNPIIEHFNLDAHSFMHANNSAITACLFSIRFFARAPTVSQLIDYLIDYLFREFFFFVCSCFRTLWMYVFVVADYVQTASTHGIELTNEMLSHVLWTHCGCYRASPQRIQLM